MRGFPLLLLQRWSVAGIAQGDRALRRFAQSRPSQPPAQLALAATHDDRVVIRPPPRRSSNLHWWHILGLHPTIFSFYIYITVSIPVVTLFRRRRLFGVFEASLFFPWRRHGTHASVASLVVCLFSIKPIPILSLSLVYFFALSMAPACVSLTSCILRVNKYMPLGPFAKYRNGSAPEGKTKHTWI